MSRKAWFAGGAAAALILAAWRCSPQLGGLAVIMFAVGAVIIYAYRML
ncbi:MAG TPA: hypothetical protein VGH03_11675 [Caulobacteraceae bacterium]|jgi:hypothetical protein